MKLARFGQITVGIDGTKMAADAGKHSAVSCEHAGKSIEQLDLGIIKSAMGFRQFLLRGVAKVPTEWTLVCLAYSLRRLHTLKRAPTAATAG